MCCCPLPSIFNLQCTQTHRPQRGAEIQVSSSMLPFYNLETLPASPRPGPGMPVICFFLRPHAPGHSELLGWPIHACLTATACFQHFCSDPSSSQYSGDPLNSFPWRASPGEQYAYRRSASEGSSSSPPWKEKERLHEAECHRAVLWS